MPSLRRQAAKGSRRQAAKGHRTVPQVALVVFNGLLAVACLGAAVGLYYTRVLVNRIDTVSVSQATRSENRDPKDPLNYLVIGTDDNTTLDESDPINTGRDVKKPLADVIMILRTDPRSGKAWLLSIPRDSLVPRAPSGREGKINSALAGPNGPIDLIQTIKRNFGISIDHYVAMDFRAFKQIVQVLGGIPAYFTNPTRDRNSGLLVEEPGCVVLDRDQALAYARARHLQYQEADGDWVSDPRGDLGRIPRQQQFAKLLVHKGLRNGVRNPGKALGVANSVIEVVQIDQRLSVQRLVDVGSQFRTFSSDQLVTYSLPTDDYNVNSGAYQKVDWEEARSYLRVFQGLESGKPTVPRDVIVDVIGDSNDNADPVSAALGALEFDSSVMVEDTSRNLPKITYGPLGASGALLVARAIAGPVELTFNETIEGQRVKLELGDLRPEVLADLRPEGAVDPEIVAELVEAGATTEGGQNPPSTLGTPDAPGVSPAPSDELEAPATGLPANGPPANGQPVDGGSSGPTTPSGEGDVPGAPAETDLPESNSTNSTTSTTGVGTDDADIPAGTEPEAGAFVPIDYDRSLACPG